MKLARTALTLASFCIIFIWAKHFETRRPTRSPEGCRPAPLDVDVDYSVSNGTHVPIPWIPPTFRVARRIHSLFASNTRLFWPPVNFNNTWYPSSLALLRRPEGGFWMLWRHVNYVLLHHGPIYTRRNDVSAALWASRLFLVSLNQDLSLDLVENPPREIVLPARLIKRPSNETTLAGFEDARVVAGQWSNGQHDRHILRFSATQQQMLPNHLKNALYYQRIAAFTLNLSSVEIISGTSLASPISMWREWEKNWLPFAHPQNTEDMLAIYELHPFTIVNITAGFVGNRKNMPWEGASVPPLVLMHKTVDTPTWFKSLRGSAGPIAWQPFVGGRKELLVIVHTRDDKGLQLFYTHRFLTLDPENYEPLRISGPLTFQKKRVEFVVGLESDSSPCCERQAGDNAIVIGYSVMDSESWVARLCSSAVNKLLKTRSQDQTLWAGGFPV